MKILFIVSESSLESSSASESGSDDFSKAACQRMTRCEVIRHGTCLSDTLFTGGPSVGRRGAVMQGKSGGDRRPDVKTAVEE